MGDWTMTGLDGHTPSWGRTPEPGKKLVEITSAEPEIDPKGKGNRIVVTYTVVEGPDTGATARDYLYILNSSFKGTDKHRAATLDNWYHLLTTLDMPVKDFDGKAVANALKGRRLGVEIVHTPGRPDPNNPDREPRPFANVSAYLPAAAIASSAVDVMAEEKPEEPDSDETAGVSLDDIV